VPLAFGVYWKRANSLSGLLSVLGGLIVWIICEMTAADAAMPPQLAGLLASVAGMLIGGFVPQSELLPVDQPIRDN